MASASVFSKAVVPLLLIQYGCLDCIVDFSCWVPFFCAVHCVLSSFAIISLSNRELVALILLCSCCRVDVGD